METPDPERLSGWLLSAGLALAGAGVAAQTTAHLLHTYVAPSVDALSADSEANAFAWASSVATFAAAFAVFLLYALVRRRGLLVLTLALGFFSLDDVAAVHERLALHAEESFGLAEYSRRAVWIVGYLPLLLVSVVLLVALARTASPRARRFVFVGLGLLGFAVVAEGSTALTYGGFANGRTYDAFEVVVEEGAELAGWILIAAALTAHMCQALMTAYTQGIRVNQAGQARKGE